MKNPVRITVAEAQAIIDADKYTVRPMEWQQKPHAADPPWQQFFTSCHLKSEVREDLIFRAMYRSKKLVVKGLATIQQEEIFTVALYVGPHRIFALDYTTTRHTNRIGFGRPYYRESFSEPHLHIWTDEGYGYAEPFKLESSELQYITRCFLLRSNLAITGGFIHPLKGITQELAL